jgi:hypothetical protein
MEMSKRWAGRRRGGCLRQSKCQRYGWLLLIVAAALGAAALGAVTPGTAAKGTMTSVAKAMGTGVLPPVNALSNVAANVTDSAMFERKPKVIIIFAGAVDLEDIIAADAPALNRFKEQSAWGIMNVRTAGAFTPENSYATLGANGRAFGSSEAGSNYRADERLSNGSAGEVFERYTGVTAQEQEVVVIDYPRLLKANSRNLFPPLLGTLGSALEQAGIRIAVCGNADTGAKPGREFVLAFMNNSGKVAMGSMGDDLLRQNAARPYGIQTDYERLWQSVDRFWESADCLVVELGDSSRLEKERDAFLPAQRQTMRRRIIEDAEVFFARLAERQLEALNEGYELAVFWVTPYPSRDAQDEGNTLTPVLISGSGFAGGLLYSASTKKNGLITIGDLQSTILAFLGADRPSSITGQPLMVMASSDNLEGAANPANKIEHAGHQLFLLNSRIAQINICRSPVLKSFVITQIIVLVLALIFIVFGVQKSGLRRLLRWLIAFVASVPLGLLVQPLTGRFELANILLFTILFGAAIALIAFWSTATAHGKGGEPIGAIALLTSFVILIDTLTGSRLMSNSVLGYSPVGGARYYGIGNEYMGVLLGSSVIGISVYLQRFGGSRKNVISAGVLLVLWAYAVSVPWHGSNLGGSLSLVTAYLVTMIGILSEKHSKKRLRTWLAAISVAVIVTAFLGLIDLTRQTETQSHIGRFASQIKQGGITFALPVIVRKLEMNLSLIGYTIWSNALLTFIVVMGILFYRPKGMLARAAAQRPVIFNGIWACIAGSVTAFAVNDSGIVAAATALLFPVALVTDHLLNHQYTINTAAIAHN